MEGGGSCAPRTELVRQISPQPASTCPETPPRPRPKQSQKVNATTQNALGWWARRRAPKDGNARHTAAPHTRHRGSGQRRSTATPRTAAPRRQIPHRIRTAPSGLDKSRINKPSTTCAQPQPHGWECPPLDVRINPMDGSVGGLPVLPPVGFSGSSELSVGGGV